MFRFQLRITIKDGDVIGLLSGSFLLVALVAIAYTDRNLTNILQILDTEGNDVRCISRFDDFVDLDRALCK